MLFLDNDSVGCALTFYGWLKACKEPQLQREVARIYDRRY